MKYILLNMLYTFILLNGSSSCSKSAHPVEKAEAGNLFVSMVLPNVAASGTVVQIQGKGFGSNQENIQVKIGDVTAEVLAVTDENISVKVPALSDKSIVNVLVFVGGVVLNTKELHVKNTGGTTIAQKDTVNWVENKDPNIAAIKPGIASYGEQVVKYIRNGRQLLEVELGKPVIVSVADKEYPWGFYNFPSIRYSVSGQLSVSWSMNHDNAESYGKPVSGNNAVSNDGGQTWTTVDKSPTGGGILLSNGDRLTITTPTAVPLKDLELPAPIATLQDGSSYGRVFRIYDHNKLPDQLQGTYQARIKKGQSSWVAERGTLVHPNFARYADGNLFPVVWWGDMQELSDGLYRGTYPGFEINQNGGVSASGVSFYKSTDFGKTWNKQGAIPYQPDIALDPNGNKRNAFGWTEPAFIALKNNNLFLSVLRTQDGFGESPMYVSTSANKGVSWSKPKVFTGAGVLPRLLELDNGIVALASGRPGVQLRFMLNNNTDDWSVPFEMLPWVNKEVFSCGYTQMLKVDENSFLIVYSDFFHKTPEGTTRKAIKVRKVTVKRF